MPVEDKIVLNEIRNRNLKVYEALFINYYPKLIRFAEGYLFDKQACEDIVQTLFIHFWENAGDINLDLSLKAYFYQSVKNRCLNHLRDLHIHDRHNLVYMGAILNQENAEETEDPEIVLQISEAISKLPKDMAEVFIMKYLEGRKLREIAQINHISENTVKTQLLRSKAKLRKLLFERTSLKFLL
jgi:RNA polymerase sigma-70 factor (family 1)